MNAKCDVEEEDEECQWRRPKAGEWEDRKAAV
jgi:hypothetical protein